MKKITLITLLFCSFTTLLAQAPQKMSYQSVIRKTDGTLVVNTLVSMKISILQDSANGTAAYVETQNTTTNVNGLATLAIGGGTPITGTFTGINWALGTYFIKIETDPTGSTNYTISGVSQLLSVPYALYSGSSQNKGKPSVMISGTISNEQAALQIQTEVGPYTENIYIQNTSGLTNVDLSSFSKVVNVVITDNTNLATINLNNLTISYGGEFTIQGNPLLSSIIGFSSLTSIGTNGFNMRNNALSSVFINTILNRMLTVTPTSGKYLLLNGQNPPAQPTGQGLLDKDTLNNTGNSVYTD